MAECANSGLKSQGPAALVIGGAHGALAIVRSLGRRGIPVAVTTGHDHPLAALSRYVGRKLPWRGPDQRNAVEDLIELARLNGLEGAVLFACGDAEVRLVAQNHEQLAKIFRLTTPPWSVTQFAYDKNLTYRRAEETGVCFPRSYHPHARSEVAELARHLPLVLKPAFRNRINAFTMSKGWKVETEPELLAQYDRAAALVGPDEIVLQEFIPGHGDSQFSYAAIWDNGSPVASLVARRTRQYPIEFGYTSTFVESVENARVEDVATRYLRSLNYSGIVELEFKHDARDDTLKLLDFNARAWTWIALGAKAGVDFPYLLWRSANGDRPEPLRNRPGAVWIHGTRDVVASLQNIFAGNLTPKAYIQSLHGPIASAAFALDDPVPGLLELPLSLYRVVTRRAPQTVKPSRVVRLALTNAYRAILTRLA